jgi:hypothetical protein
MRWTRQEGRLFRTAAGRFRLEWGPRREGAAVAQLLDAWWEAGEWWEGDLEERQVLRLLLADGRVVEVSAPLTASRREALAGPGIAAGRVRLEAWLD